MEDKLLTNDLLFMISEMHLLTTIVLYDGKLYASDKQIPYPKTDVLQNNNLSFFMVWEDENGYDEKDYDEIYNGIEQLWTNLAVKISLDKIFEEVFIVAQCFLSDFPKFLENLKKDNFAVYHNEEYTPFKWLAWIKESNVRLIHQHYQDFEVNIKFDILIDKEILFRLGENMIKKMQVYVDKEQNRYKEYVAKKYRQ